MELKVFSEAKNNLQEKYKNNKEWLQSTPTYGCWIYPAQYYEELVDLVVKNEKEEMKEELLLKQQEIQQIAKISALLGHDYNLYRVTYALEGVHANWKNENHSIVWRTDFKDFVEHLKKGNLHPERWDISDVREKVSKII